MQALFSFPNPVNEVSARLVAGGVVVWCAATLLFNQPLLMIPLAYGFIARVLTGPTLSPWGQIVTRVLTPMLNVEAKLVPGAPKRFAQGIGAVLSSTAVILHFGIDVPGLADLAVGAILIAASLESFFGLCLGCVLFAGLQRARVIPESACEDCGDIWGRTRVPA